MTFSNLSTIDPRSTYDTMQDVKFKAFKALSKKIDPNKKNFKNVLDKEIKKTKLKEVAQQFESLFVNMMFKSLRKNLNKHRLIKENPAENIFSDMLYQEYSLQIAKTGEFGLAKQIYKWGLPSLDISA